MIKTSDPVGSTPPPPRRRRRLAPAGVLLAVVALLAASCNSPQGSLDSAVAISGVSTGVRVSGWAWDQDSADILTIEVQIDGVPRGTTLANLPRPDVGAAVSGAGGNRGFDTTVATSAGGHTVCVVARDATGDDAATTLGCRGVTVFGTQSPQGSFDSIAYISSPSGVRVTGWTRDPDTTAAVSVQVRVDNTLVTTITTDQPRPDVAGAFPGAGPNTGFDATVATSAAAHTVCLTAVDVAGGNGPTTLGCRSTNGIMRGSTASRSFLQAKPDTTPLRWNPCTPIHYVANLTEGYPGALGDLQYAVAQISAATGITFVYDGASSSIPNSSYGGTPVGSGYAPVLVGFVHRNQTDLFGPPGDGVLALGGPRAITVGGTLHSYVTGAVAVDVDTANPYLNRGTGQQSFGVLLMHELGHVMGLGHYNDQLQLMYPTITANYTDFGAGDRAGLTSLGTTMGCVAATAQPDRSAAAPALPTPGPLAIVPETGHEG